MPTQEPALRLPSRLLSLFLARIQCTRLAHRISPVEAHAEPNYNHLLEDLQDRPFGRGEPVSADPESSPWLSCCCASMTLYLRRRHRLWALILATTCTTPQGQARRRQPACEYPAGCAASVWLYMGYRISKMAAQEDFWDSTFPPRELNIGMTSDWRVDVGTKAKLQLSCQSRRSSMDTESPAEFYPRRHC